VRESRVVAIFNDAYLKSTTTRVEQGFQKGSLFS
jgi:hypothetical protein